MIHINSDSKMHSYEDSDLFVHPLAVWRKNKYTPHGSFLQYLLTFSTVAAKFSSVSSWHQFTSGLPRALVDWGWLSWVLLCVHLNITFHQHGPWSPSLMCQNQSGMWTNTTNASDIMEFPLLRSVQLSSAHGSRLGCLTSLADTQGFPTHRPSLTIHVIQICCLFGRTSSYIWKVQSHHVGAIKETVLELKKRKY